MDIAHRSNRHARAHSAFFRAPPCRHHSSAPCRPCSTQRRIYPSLTGAEARSGETASSCVDVDIVRVCFKRTAPTATQDNMARPTVAQRPRAPDTRTVPAALLKLARFEEALADAAECLRHDAASIEARPHCLFGMP